MNPAHRPDHWVRLQNTPRDAEIIQMRMRGFTYKKIAEELHIAPPNASTVVKRYLRQVITEPSKQLLEKELLEIQELYNVAMEAVRTFTPVVVNGNVVQVPVLDAQGNAVLGIDNRPVIAPLRDYSPVLSGINTCVRLLDKKHRLLGLDEPQRLVGSSEPVEAITFRIVDSAAQIKELKDSVGEVRHAMQTGGPAQAHTPAPESEPERLTFPPPPDIADHG